MDRKTDTLVSIFLAAASPSSALGTARVSSTCRGSLLLLRSSTEPTLALVQQRAEPGAYAALF